MSNETRPWLDGVDGEEAVELIESKAEIASTPSRCSKCVLSSANAINHFTRPGQFKISSMSGCDRMYYSPSALAHLRLNLFATLANRASRAAVNIGNS